MRRRSRHLTGVRQNAAGDGAYARRHRFPNFVEYRIFIRLLPKRPCATRRVRPDAPSRKRAIPDAPRLRRTALPVELLVPARRVASGRARRARAGAGLRGARDHRRVLVLGHRPRASRGEGGRPPARRRQRDHARRRREARAARHRSRELRQPVATDHARAAQRGEGQLCALPRRRRGVRGRPPRAVGAVRRAGSTRLRRRSPRCDEVESPYVPPRAGSPPPFPAARGSPSSSSPAPAIAPGSRTARRSPARPACRRSPPATSTCTSAPGARCRTRSPRSA